MPSSEQPWFTSSLRCLQCAGRGLTLSPDSITCPTCAARWPVVDGIPMLGGPPPAAGPAGSTPAERHAATEAAVRQFYEKTPFPTYEDFDSIGSLVEKARRSIYARLLDEQIPVGARVLECGCGTGQLSTFLSISNRSCLGVDLCMASLRCGYQFRQRHGLQRVDFLQGNLFDLPVAEESFDLVISKGVLHHTPDAHRAFLNVARRVRKGGYLIIGLYNTYGRVPSWLRKQMYRVLGRDAFGGDYVMRKLIQSDEKRRVWWEDQYNNPHETWHSVDEVMGWFKEAGITYLNAYPRVTLGGEDSAAPQLFSPTRPGGAAEHVLVQLGWMFTIAREGALFDLIGRRA